MLGTKLFIFLSGITIAFSRRGNFYRKDYTYVVDFDAFYKLHKNGASYNSAFLACDDEGAKLFYPKEKDEWTIVKKIISALSHPPNTSEVIVGIHDSGFGEFITVDGQSTPMPLDEQDEIAEGNYCVLMNIETGKLRIDVCDDQNTTSIPFVCKKVDEKPCPTIDQRYIFKAETKKCYKVSERKRTWTEAMHTCLMEGGKLVVVKDSREGDIVANMLRGLAPYFTGFRRTSLSGVYYTVNGEKLEETGYYNWDDRGVDLLYDCGVMYRMQKMLSTKSEKCNEINPYVCEMAANV